MRERERVIRVEGEEKSISMGGRGAAPSLFVLLFLPCPFYFSTRRDIKEGGGD